MNAGLARNTGRWDPDCSVPGMVGRCEDSRRSRSEMDGDESLCRGGRCGLRGTLGRVGAMARWAWWALWWRTSWMEVAAGKVGWE